MTRVATTATLLWTLIVPWTQANAVDGDTQRGQKLFGACAACHSLEANRNMTGPSLAELWNRMAGNVASFPRYSPALKSANLIWDDKSLDEWIKDRQHFVPGNTMPFPGMPDPRARRDLLAYLKEATQPRHMAANAESTNRMDGMGG